MRSVSPRRVMMHNGGVSTQFGQNISVKCAILRSGILLSRITSHIKLVVHATQSHNVITAIFASVSTHCFITSSQGQFRMFKFWWAACFITTRQCSSTIPLLCIANKRQNIFKYRSARALIWVSQCAWRLPAKHNTILSYYLYIIVYCTM